MERKEIEKRFDNFRGDRTERLMSGYRRRKGVTLPTVDYIEIDRVEKIVTELKEQALDFMEIRQKYVPVSTILLIATISILSTIAIGFVMVKTIFVWI